MEQQEAAKLANDKPQEANHHQQCKAKREAATAVSAPRAPSRCLPKEKRMARDHVNDTQNIARRINKSTNENKIVKHRHELL